MKDKNSVSVSFLSVLFILTAVFLVAFPSCSRGNAGEEKGGAASEGTELRYGLTTEPVTLDPLNPANTADGRSILFNVFEGLVKPDSSGGLVPAMAESFSIEQDGLVYVFTIREGITFHDGTPLTANDAVFSLNTAADAKFPGLTAIEKTEITGPREIRITLKESDPDFLPYLTVGIAPASNPDREKNPAGSGPFMIESYAPQQNLKLVKNPGYWQSGLPKLDRVTIVFAADTDALLTGLKGGNIDGASVTGSLLPQLDAEQFSLFPWYSNTVQLMALNNEVKPLNDLRVRRAINYAVDVPEIIETAFYGKGEPSGSPVIPGLKNVYETSLRNPYPRDISRAKQLLAEAGFPDGFPLEITVPSNYTMHVDTAQVIVNQLAEAGIAAAIRLVDWATWLSDIYSGRNYEATIVSLDANNVSPRSFLSRYHSLADDNFLNFKNADYDRVYDAALVEGDDAKRIALYKEAQRIISDNAAAVYIQDIVGFRAFTGGAYAGVLNYPLYIIDFAPVYKTP